MTGMGFCTFEDCNGHLHRIAPADAKYSVLPDATVYRCDTCGAEVQYPPPTAFKVPPNLTGRIKVGSISIKEEGRR